MAYDDRNERRHRGWGRESPSGAAIRASAAAGAIRCRAPHRLGDRASAAGRRSRLWRRTLWAGRAGRLWQRDLTGGGIGYGPGYDPEFSGGPRFDRADVGSVGTHGVHPVASLLEPRLRRRRRRHVRQLGARLSPSAVRTRIMRNGGSARSTRSTATMTNIGARTSRASTASSAPGARSAAGSARRSARSSEHMEVVGSDGAHVGTVDCTRGDSIVLTKSDESGRRRPSSDPLRLGGEASTTRWR